MYFLTLRETEEFVSSICDCSVNNIREMQPPTSSAKLIEQVDMNVDLQEFVPHCQNVLSKISVPGMRMLWILSQGNWHSQENRHAYYRLRLSYGETAPNFVKPGLFFEEFESSDLLTFFEMAVRYAWDAALLHHATSPVIYISRNGEARIFGPSPIQSQ